MFVSEKVGQLSQADVGLDCCDCGGFTLLSRFSLFKYFLKIKKFRSRFSCHGVKYLFLKGSGPFRYDVNYCVGFLN